MPIRQPAKTLPHCAPLTPALAFAALPRRPAALRRLNANASKCDCTVLFLNQMRQKVGVIFGNPEITSGGNALKFYSSVRLDIRRKETLRDAKNEEKGIKVRVKVTKNKVAPPYKIGVFDIMFDRGINREGSLLDVAEELGVVEKKGSWYSMDGDNIGQGRENTVQFLLDNEEAYKAVHEGVSYRLAKAKASPAQEPTQEPTLPDDLMSQNESLLGEDAVEDLAGQV